MVTEPTEGVVKSAETLFAVINGLKHLDGATVTELAHHLDIPPSTTHRHLKTLRQHGYVTKTDGEYQLGLKFLDLGSYARHRIDAAREIKPTIKELADETGESANFIMEDDGIGVFVHRQMSRSGVHADARVGKRLHLHLTSGGKAILAHLPDERIDRIIDQRGLPQKTDKSIGDRSQLFTELEEIRNRGYAFNRNETTEGLHSVGAPVHGPDGRVLGSVSVSGPAYRLDSDRMDGEIADAILERINEFELNFTYSRPTSSKQ